LPEQLTVMDAHRWVDASAWRTAMAEGTLRVDASGLLRFDSAALGALLALRRKAQSEGGLLHIEQAPAALGALARAYGVIDLLPGL